MSVPDTELLRLCAEFARLDAEASAASESDDDDASDRMSVAMAACRPICDRVQAMPAATVAGHRAKAAVALALLAEEFYPAGADKSLDFIRDALRDFVEAPHRQREEAAP